MSKILIVEDDKMCRFMLEEMLDDLGVDFVSAKDGEEALSQIAIHGESLRLVLMDIHMPNITGDEAVRIIRSSPANPPRDISVIAMTADHQWHDPKKLEAVGFSGAMPKPISLDMLRSKVA